MLGIDIVDIQDPTFRERNERSLDLIRNEHDELINHRFIFWLLWSAKEAVFKYKREPLNFAPTKIPISLQQTGDEITFSSEGASGKILITDEHILAICGELDQLELQIFEQNNKNWSQGIRFMITDFFREKGHDYHVAADELNLPKLQPSGDLISISHHGRFGAVLFPKSLL